MAVYIPHSIFRLARILYVRQENFGPNYVFSAVDYNSSTVKYGTCVADQWLRTSFTE